MKKLTSLAVVENWNAADQERTDALFKLPRELEDDARRADETMRSLRKLLDDERFQDLTDTDAPVYWLCRNIGTVMGELGERQLDVLLEDRRGKHWPRKYAASWALHKLVGRSVLGVAQLERILDVYRDDLRGWPAALSAKALPPGFDGPDFIDAYLPALQWLGLTLKGEGVSLPAALGQELADVREALSTEPGDWYATQFRQLIEISTDQLELTVAAPKRKKKPAATKRHPRGTTPRSRT